MSRLFSPCQLGGMALPNRVMMSPMQRWQGTAESFATAYHTEHYGRRARAGIGMVMVESTALAAAGRLFPDDIGIFTEAHVAPLARVAAAIKAGGARAAIQLSHGGRKSHRSTGARLLAPSAIAFNAAYGTPEAMDRADIDAAIMAFMIAARRSLEAGFEIIEIHAAHGYLLHQFLSPLSNTREDRYGGNPANRARLLHEVFAAVRTEVGPAVPLLVRVSATDFAEGGLQPEAVAQALAPLVALGLAAVDVSAGGLLPIVPPNIGPEYQVPYATLLRERLGLPVIAVGLIRNGGSAERILAEGRADLVAIGRPLLENPNYVQGLRADAEAAAG